MNGEIECPYCLNEQTWDDYYETEEEEEAIDEIQCNTCNKYFAATWSQGSVILEAEKAPCMNGGDHNLKKFFSSSHDSCFRCEYCDYEERGELNEVTKEMLKRD